MKHWLLNCLLAVMVILSGCTDPVQPPAGNSRTKIKLKDISPSTKQSLPPDINFQFITFQMPADEFPLLQQAFNSLRKTNFLFSDYFAFEANGFAAGFGRNQMWTPVASTLQQAETKRISTNNLIIYDDTPFDIFVSEILEEKTVFHSGADNSVIGTSLADGVLAWRISARHAPILKSVANVGIQPIFSSGFNSQISRLTGVKKTEQVVFEPMSFELKMRAGDFVLLGPGKYEKDELTLSSLFFITFGDFIRLKSDKVAENEFPIDKPGHVLQRNIPLINCYLLICTKVGD